MTAGLTVLATVAYVMLSASGLAQKPALVTVFVGAVVQDGFVDAGSGVVDSVKDVRRALLKKKGLQLTEQADGADVVLHVLGRGIESEAAGSTTMPAFGGYVTAPRYVGWKVLDVGLKAGEYTRTMRATTNSHEEWRDCAGDIAKQVDAWINANRDRLIQRRTK